MLGDVALAMVLGALLGLERELAHKSAGLRTHMLVAGSAAMLVEVDAPSPPVRCPRSRRSCASTPSRSSRRSSWRWDSWAPARSSGGDDGHVEGLTTAAAMLFSAAVGSAVGLRQFVLAVGATVLALVTLHLVGALEEIVGTAPGAPAGLKDGLAAGTKLSRGIGVFDATALVVGSMIGSGIFIVSAESARVVGSPGWLLAAWAIAGR